MTVQGSPDLAAFRAWLSLNDPSDVQDDTVLTDSLNAGLAQQAHQVCYPQDSFGTAVMTDDLREAVFLRAQRLVARRNSPEGIVGIAGGGGGDFSSVRVPPFDVDVNKLEAPHRRIAIA